MSVRGRSDDEIECATARLAAACDQSRCEPAPLARDGCVDRERIERRLDDPEPLDPTCSLVVGSSDQHAEVEFRKRRGADRTLELTWALCADQHRRVEQCSHG